MWLMVLTGLLFLFLGGLFFFKPLWVWEITEAWKTYGQSEPSDLYLLSTKIGGVVLAGIGLYFVIGAIIYWNA